MLPRSKHSNPSTACGHQALSRAVGADRLLECAAKSGQTRYTHEPNSPSDPGPPEPKTYPGLRSNSAQKTSLIDEDCPHLICYAPPPSITDVRLNLTPAPRTLVVFYNK
jgi:hypothetical protein